MVASLGKRPRTAFEAAVSRKQRPNHAPRQFSVILAAMRQRFLATEHRAEITRIDPAAAHFAFASSPARSVTARRWFTPMPSALAGAPFEGDDRAIASRWNVCPRLRRAAPQRFVPEYPLASRA